MERSVPDHSLLDTVANKSARDTTLPRLFRRAVIRSSSPRVSGMLSPAGVIRHGTSGLSFQSPNGFTAVAGESDGSAAGFDASQPVRRSSARTLAISSEIGALLVT